MEYNVCVLIKMSFMPAQCAPITSTVASKSTVLLKLPYFLKSKLAPCS